MIGGDWRRAPRLTSIWLTPPLLLAVPAALIAEGRDGLWLALLVVVAPFFAFLASAPDRAPGKEDHVLPAVLVLLVAGLLVWANLSLAGDVAAWMGWPRWRGVVPSAVVALAFVLGPSAARRWSWLLPLGLVLLLLPVVVVARASRSDPISTWNYVAFEPAFRFPADSPWVREGRAVGPRRGSRSLRFDEEHRVTPVDPGPLRVEVSDSGRVQLQEWTLAAGQSVTLRPGDRLLLTGPSRLRFEADKRVPGAPASGIAWADSSRSARPVLLARLSGLALTLVGGALALAALAGPARPTRLGVGLGGVALLVMLGWAECWAVYAVRWAPELFLGGASAAALVELPALALRGSPWGSRLAALALAGLLALFLAGLVALREELALEQDDSGLWSVILAGVALLALWPFDPSTLLLSALGLAASTLAPLALIGASDARPSVVSWALGLGLVLFLGLTALERLGVPASAVAREIVAYPALVAAPMTAGVLWVARRPPRA